MPAKLRSRLTYANVMATIAVFIALGGSSYAAVRLSKNTVRSTHIKNGQVKKPDLAASAVDSSKVGDGALLARDFAAGQLPKGDKGDKGETGAQGLAGETGAQGLPGLSALEPVTQTSGSDSNSGKAVNLTCPGGKTLIAVFGSLQGGFSQGAFPNGLSKVVFTSLDRTSATAARVVAVETDGGTTGSWSVGGTALCAHVAP